MGRPKVSLILPISKEAPYLKQCMDTITKQTLKDIEIICINYGVAERNLEIINSYAKKTSWITVIDIQNVSYGSGINFGIKKATGKYVGIVDTNDFVAADMFEKLYNIANKNRLDIVKCNFYEFDETYEKSEDVLRQKKVITNKKHYGRVIDLFECPEIVAIHDPRAIWAGIYSTDFLQKYNILYHETQDVSCHDISFSWMALSHARKVYFLNKAYYNHRVETSNSFADSKDEAFAINIEFDHIKAMLLDDDNEKLWDKFKPYYHHNRYYSYCIAAERIAIDIRREFWTRMKSEFERANQLDELRVDLFPENYYKSIIFLLTTSVECFDEMMTLTYENKALLAENKKLKKKLKKIRSSNSFKIGKKITAMPSRVKKCIKR